MSEPVQTEKSKKNLAGKIVSGVALATVFTGAAGAVVFYSPSHDTTRQVLEQKGLKNIKTSYGFVFSGAPACPEKSNGIHPTAFTATSGNQQVSGVVCYDTVFEKEAHFTIITPNTTRNGNLTVRR